MFSNFTEKARIAIQNAHDAACELGHGYIGSEHLLLGILTEGTGVGAKILENAGAKKEVLIKRIEEVMGRNMPLSKNSELALTPRSKRILEIAAMEARNMGHNYIGTEHILIGIIKDGDGVGANILASCNVDFNNIYNDIISSTEQGYSEQKPTGKQGVSGGKTP
ncbi:MAG TPA: ATP-dependent Clp protease ATP-binding protein ClpC, partial [Clostridiales bacterium]|nr:ATP-dependent Clp protease ATP-binding protein ClpC [Clostridiales bacterium]